MIRYFDIGSYIGIIAKTVTSLFEEMGLNYEAHLFEPCESYMKELEKVFNTNTNVMLHKLAVSNKEGNFPLYHSNISGHSLHSTKSNVNKDDFEMIDCIVFSEWFKKSFLYKGNDIYILRVDIEGSEYEFYTDLIESGIYNQIDIFSGSLSDLYKLTNVTKKEADDFKFYLQSHNIDVITINSGTVMEDVMKIRRAVDEKDKIF